MVGPGPREVVNLWVYDMCELRVLYYMFASHSAVLNVAHKGYTTISYAWHSGHHSALH